MRNLIVSIEKWYEKSAQEITDILNEKNIEYRNDDLFTYLGVRNIIGPVGAAILVTTMEQVAANLEKAEFGSEEWASGVDLTQGIKAFCGGKGIQLSLSEVQNQIDLLSGLGNWPADLAKSIKDIGLCYFSVYNKAGYTGDIFLDVVELTIKSIKFEQEKETYIREQEDRWNKFQEAISAWDGTTERPVM